MQYLFKTYLMYFYFAQYAPLSRTHHKSYEIYLIRAPSSSLRRFLGLEEKSGNVEISTFFRTPHFGVFLDFQAII